MQTFLTGYVHTLALDTDGVVYAWGSNSNGQFDIFYQKNFGKKFLPIIQYIDDKIRLGDGKLTSNYTQIAVPTNGKKIVKIAAGSFNFNIFCHSQNIKNIFLFYFYNFR